MISHVLFKYLYDITQFTKIGPKSTLNIFFHFQISLIKLCYVNNYVKTF